MQRKLFGFLFLLFPFIVISQNVEITGNAAFFANEEIEVLHYSNRISSDLELLLKKDISDGGNYNLQLQIEKPTELIIRIEMREFPIKVHPNTIIEINFLPIENADNQKVPLRTGIKYLKHPTNTATIFDYQNLELNFAHYQMQIQLGQKILSLYSPYFDSLEIQYAAILKTDTFFLHHYTYFKAKAMLQTGKSHKEIFDHYFKGKEILYQQDNYLDLFSSITGMRLYNYFKKNLPKTQKAVTQYQVYEQLKRLISEDSVFLLPEVQNLALLFYSMHPKPISEISVTTWPSVINQMANFCPYSEIKNAAFSIQSKKHRFERGNEAPIIKLLNTQGELKSLTDFRGRYTYLGFINSKSRTCVQDVIVTSQIKKKYSKVNYVFVICDRDSLEMQNLPKESSNLRYLFIDKDYASLKEYEIWNFPVYYLLDKHGYFLQSPAERPMDIVDDFAILFAKKTKRRSYEIIKE